jgi:peptidyl-prolyl cis-trans isomerase SurA
VKQALLLGLGLFWGSAHAAPVDRVAAVVNNKVITLSQVYEYERGRAHIERLASSGSAGDRRAAELEVLDQLIRETLIEQEMNRLKISVEDHEVDAQIDLIIEQNGFEDRDELRRAVEDQAQSWATFFEGHRRGIRIQKFQMYIIRPRVVENEDALRDAYNRLVNNPDRPEIVELGGLFVPLRADTDAERERVTAIVADAKRRFEAGESFAALSKELDVAGFGQAGGNMGSFRQGEIMAELDGPAFSTPVGQVSDPVVTGRGVYLIEVRGRELEPLGTFDELKPRLSQEVFESQYQREEDAWYQSQRRRSSVDVKLEEPESL